MSSSPQISTTSTNAIIEYDVSAAESEILSAWQQYQTTEKYGLEFGRLCWEWRNKSKAQGSHKGRGFEQLCTKLGIPRRTAYHWITEYEISIAVRAPKPEPEAAPSEPEEPEADPDTLLDGPLDDEPLEQDAEPEPSEEPEEEPETQPETATSPSARQLIRLQKAKELEEENLFPRFDTKITPAVVSGAPDGIGFNVTFKNLKGAEAVRQLSKMPIEVPTGVLKLVEIDKAHFAAVFGNLSATALEGRIARLVEILNEEYGGGA